LGQLRNSSGKGRGYVWLRASFGTGVVAVRCLVGGD
jgi:hypothetical protein